MLGHAAPTVAVDALVVKEHKATAAPYRGPPTASPCAATAQPLLRRRRCVPSAPPRALYHRWPPFGPSPVSAAATTRLAREEDGIAVRRLGQASASSRITAARLAMRG